MVILSGNGARKDAKTLRIFGHGINHEDKKGTKKNFLPQRTPRTQREKKSS